MPAVVPAFAMRIRTVTLGVALMMGTCKAWSQRAEVCIDKGWRFALGHAWDANKDFKNGTGAFSYFAKAGYGDGAAAAGFDDRSWRSVDLPHDWAVELPFDARGSGSHGYRALGRAFPQNSVGWYRKSFYIPATDDGRRISIRFDGVFRDAKVWVNGFYLGNEQGGYNGFSYDITDYLHYGGENTIAVRADATMEEGWFYEGAGIYRHVWLVKTGGLHIAENGIWVRSHMDGSCTTKVSLINEGRHPDTVSLHAEVMDAGGTVVATGQTDGVRLEPGQSAEVPYALRVDRPRLWSVDDPYLYKMVTWVSRRDNACIDSCVTAFGIRSIRWDPDAGFFLNGRHVELKGTNEHQDHAGVGVAVPDGLWDYRIRCLKEVGANAYRCAHNPPAPELLDACDRLGMLVIDENRWMAVTPQLKDPLRRMILRDRNHPSIIAWSIGNEEWAMEGTSTGARVASTLQDYVHTLDTTRPVTAAISGGWGRGISSVIELMGYNYIAQGSTDEQHLRFPGQPGVGTEEGQVTTMRGVYVDDPAAHRIASYDRPPLPGFGSLEDGWKHYAARPYLAGMFIWSGFDYRGEPAPFGWPSVASSTGILDACGFPKDIAWYFRSWWTEQPTVHLFPHWNWPGRDGQRIIVWAYSNSDEVELFLNGKSQGRRLVRPNGHVEWAVDYRPGVLKAVGYKQGKKIATDIVQTTGRPTKIVLQTSSVRGVAVVTVKAVDATGLSVPVADNEIAFRVDGPARIIGVGNGDPDSHEADKYVEQVFSIPVADLRAKTVAGDRDVPEVAAGYADTDWSRDLDRITDDTSAKMVVYRGDIEIPDSGSMRLYYKSIGTAQQVWLNGRLLGLPGDTSARSEFPVDRGMLRKGNNVLAIVAHPFRRRFRWDEVNHDPGVLRVVVPAGQWKRRLFNGLAQVILEPTGEPGVVTLTATSEGLEAATIVICK